MPALNLSGALRAACTVMQATGEICVSVGWSGDVLQAKSRGAEAEKPVRVTYAIPKLDPITARTACENQPLVLHNLGAGEFAGNAANDATLRVKVAYRVHTFGF